MIKNNAEPLASSHFIDNRVDAGELINECCIKVKLGDTLETIKNNLYFAQLKLHNQICQKIINNEILKTKKIVRPFKNSLMTEKQKKISLINFDNWKNHYLSKD